MQLSPSSASFRIHLNYFPLFPTALYCNSFPALRHIFEQVQFSKIILFAAGSSRVHQPMQGELIAYPNKLKFRPQIVIPIFRSGSRPLEKEWRVDSFHGVQGRWKCVKVHFFIINNYPPGVHAGSTGS